MDCGAISIKIQVRLFIFFLLLQGCQEKIPKGSVLVRAPNSGTYEIYRIASESPFQFISEQIGYFNQSLKLPIGQYLILADCSFERIMVQPNQEINLITHLVQFLPPEKPNDRDSFSIQCDRFSKTRLRQHLFNRYRLNILHGNREMLVAMVPFQIDFKAQGYENPQVLTYQLSAVKLESYDNMNPKTSYFVSPAEGLISVTKDQEFGHWQFLMPGPYQVEVNGTKMSIDLVAGEKRTIAPSFLKITVDPEVDLKSSSNILGTPLFVELNDSHWLDLNETYPVLPGTARIKLNGSNESEELTLEEGRLIEKRARSLVVEFDCPPWEWNCLGNRKVFLYNKDKPYPFAEGISDVPLLFFETDAWVSIQGSRDIRYQLDPSQNNFRLKVGKAKFIPTHFHRPNLITDLSRVEAIELPFTGHTLDLPIEREVVVPLIAGAYHFAQYTSIYGNEYERRQSKKWIQIRAHETTEIPFQVYVSERKFKQLQLAKERLIAKRKNRKQVDISVDFRPIIPIQVQ